MDTGSLAIVEIKNKVKTPVVTVVVSKGVHPKVNYLETSSLHVLQIVDGKQQGVITVDDIYPGSRLWFGKKMEFVIKKVCGLLSRNRTM